MNSANDILNRSRGLVAMAVASILLASCAVAPTKPTGANEVRAKLTRLEANADLATRAPEAIADAEAAVRLAEQPETDAGLAEYHVYIADRKVDTAMALAQTRYYEDQRAALEAEQQNARLDARTREAQAAKQAASQARNEANAANAAAANSADQANAANAAAAASANQAAELQRRIEELQFKVTDRGLVLTLGDVLFATGQSDLIAGATSHLSKLADFLNKYPDRNVLIEGYTDSTGGQSYNQALSERRAESVRGYLMAHGVDGTRISASGKGMSNPIAGNDTATGRQQNRRVEVIVSNPATASR